MSILTCWSIGRGVVLRVEEQGNDLIREKSCDEKGTKQIQILTEKRDI